MMINRKRISILLCTLIFAILIEYIYFNYTAYIFAYTGIRTSFDLFRQILEMVFLLLLVSMSSFLMHDTILFFINLIFICFSCIPIVSLWPISVYVKWEYIFYTFIYWFLFEILMVAYDRKLYRINNMDGINCRFRDSAYKIVPDVKYLNQIMIIVTLFSLYMAFRYGRGLRYVSFTDAESIRLGLREIAMPAIVRYPFMILGGVILPVVSIYSLIKKKSFALAFSVLSSFLLYSVNGMKSWILFQLIAMALYFLVKKKRISGLKASALMMLYVNIGLVAVIVIYMFFHNTLPLAYEHRAFTIYPEITYYCFDFFSPREPILLRDSLLSRFFDSPYNMVAGRLIGRLYYNSPSMNACVGTVGDAFANAKFSGIILYPIALTYLMYLLSKEIRLYESAFSYLISFMLSYQFIGNTFSTCLITGGYLIIYIMLRIYNKKDNSEMVDEK